MDVETPEDSASVSASGEISLGPKDTDVIRISPDKEMEVAERSAAYAAALLAGPGGAKVSSG